MYVLNDNSKKSVNKFLKKTVVVCMTVVLCFSLASCKKKKEEKISRGYYLIMYVEH